MLVMSIVIIGSISESHLSKFPLRVLHDHHGSTVSQKYTLTSGDDAPEESFHPLLFVYMSCALNCTSSKVFASSLCLVLKNLKGPNKPESNHGCTARAEKLTYFFIE
jgi:hypothetical protein